MAGLPSATTKETLTINADDLPTLSNGCKPITRAKVCARPMLSCNGARNAVLLLHILNDRSNGSPRHETLYVLRQRVSEILCVNSGQARTRLRPGCCLLLQEALKELLWRGHAV